MSKKDFDEATVAIKECVDNRFGDYMRLSDTSNDESSDINTVIINGETFNGLSIRTIMKIRLALFDDVINSIECFDNELKDHLSQKKGWSDV